MNMDYNTLILIDDIQLNTHQEKKNKRQGDFVLTFMVQLAHRHSSVRVCASEQSFTHVLRKGQTSRSVLKIISGDNSEQAVPQTWQCGQPPACISTGRVVMLDWLAWFRLNWAIRRWWMRVGEQEKRKREAEAEIDSEIEWANEGQRDRCGKMEVEGGQGAREWKSLKPFSVPILLINVNMHLTLNV